MMHLRDEIIGEQVGASGEHIGEAGSSEDPALGSRCGMSSVEIVVVLAVPMLELDNNSGGKIGSSGPFAIAAASGSTPGAATGSGSSSAAECVGECGGE